MRLEVTTIDGATRLYAEGLDLHPARVRAEVERLRAMTWRYRAVRPVADRPDLFLPRGEHAVLEVP